jgi:hypothetical protein
LDEATSGTSEDDRGALGDINGDSSLTQTSLKIAEVKFHVADEQRWPAGRGYDGRVVRVDG